MNAAFLDHELVSRRVKVGAEWQTKVFPVVGGRLRILHETNESLNIQTEILRLDSDFVVIKATVETGKGKFNGTGTASSQRDARLADSLVELAETRAIARSLRFSGIGCEYTSAEEVSHVAPSDPEPEPREENGNGTKAAVKHNGNATQAQCRALYTLTKKAQYADEDVLSMLRPFQAMKFEDLQREAASQLITYLQTEVA